VLLSAGAEPGVRLRDVGFLTKPLDFGELLAVVDRILGQRRPLTVATG
jgi:hypothetical protein